MWEIFEKLRNEKDVTAAEICRTIGIDPSSLSNWKKGRYTPKADKLQKLAEYFGVSLEYLMTGDESLRYQSSAAAPLTPDELDVLRLYRSIPQTKRPHVCAILESVSQMVA